MLKIATRASLAGLLAAAAAHAQTVPSGFSSTDLLPGGTAGGASAMAQAPDGRIYIAQQGGTIRVWDPNAGLVAANFYSFPVEFSGERGLIGIAVDPNWSTNRYVYAHYSRSGGAGPIVKRVTASATNPNAATAGTEITLVDLGPYAGTANYHVGGGMRFGPDGKLYLGLGDNGDGNRAQALTTLFGKVLRINPIPGNAIPTDNPLSFPGITGSPSGLNRLIWAVGLRNPFTMGFHPTTGRFFINDVGQNDWEEIDDGLRGANYGWPVTEGDFTQASFPNFTRPFHFYSHGVGQCITGGQFYHPPQHTLPPAYADDYFFGDYVAGWVKRIDLTTRTVTDFATGMSGVVGMDTDAQGRLLILTGAPAHLYRVSYTATLAPSVITQPATQTVPKGGTAVFSVYAAGNATLSYQWRHNTAPIPGATSSTLTISNVDCDDAGTYDVVISNAAGSATSSAASLNGVSSCYVNCDCSVIEPLANVADFTCFLQRFAAGDPYANCDQSTTPPTLNVADFTCFLTKFALGCPPPP